MKGCVTACFIHSATLVGLRRKLVHGHGFTHSQAAGKFMQHTSASRIATPPGHSRLAAGLGTVAILLTLALPAQAHPWQRHGPPAGPQPRASIRPQQHHGREHLTEWFQNHRSMTLKQQESALRHQPGFNRLSPAQRQRILHRLRFLHSQPPAVRARIMARNEAFERLSPERKQEVRAAAQAFQRMPQYRKQQLGRAFHTLRTLPPDQRATILHSARFQSQFSARERHILSNLLSIEPWQPAQQPPPPHPPRR